MSTELYRKYIDIINENSNQAINDDETRYQVIKDMGQTRYLISQFVKTLGYNPNSKNLTKLLAGIQDSVHKIAQHGDRKPGLYKNEPATEYRMINDAEVNILRNQDYLYKLMNNKQVDELTNLMINAEKSLLNTAKEIHKSMGGPMGGSDREFNSYFK